MDNKIQEAIQKTAANLNVSEFKTTKIVENIFNYLSNSMNKTEYSNYKISYFGSFNIIEKRFLARKERLNNKLNNTNENDKIDKSRKNVEEDGTSEE